MDDKRKLEELRERLTGLKENQSKANCSTSNSSPADMQREMEIEELEDQIKALKGKATR